MPSGSPASEVSFLLVHASGSSPGAITAGAGATPAQVAAENHRLGWDAPLVTQYLTWLGHAARGARGLLGEHGYRKARHPIGIDPGFTGHLLDRAAAPEPSLHLADRQ